MISRTLNSPSHLPSPNPTISLTHQAPPRKHCSILSNDHDAIPPTGRSLRAGPGHGNVRAAMKAEAEAFFSGRCDVLLSRRHKRGGSYGFKLRMLPDAILGPATPRLQLHTDRTPGPCIAAAKHTALRCAAVRCAWTVEGDRGEANRKSWGSGKVFQDGWCCVGLAHVR